jgi:hypothetical protein
MLDKKFWDKEGPIIRDKYRKHIFAKARDVNSRSFKGYSKEYGERKRANKFKRQASKYANTKAPVLTGDLLKDFGSYFETGKNGVTFGWSTFGKRVEHLADNGRELTTESQPLPKGILKYLNHKADKYIENKLGPDKTKTITIGKK